ADLHAERDVGAADRHCLGPARGAPAKEKQHHLYRPEPRRRGPLAHGPPPPTPPAAYPRGRGPSPRLVRSHAATPTATATATHHDHAHREYKSAPAPRQRREPSANAPIFPDAMLPSVE